MGLKKTFEKQGGMCLIGQYARGGALFTASAQFVLLGKSRTALEILRLSAHLKIKQKLQKKYRKTLIEFDKCYDDSLPHTGSNKVWICWFQGMENAPVLVQKCYESVKEHLKDREIILLTSENLKDYVSFPDYIIEKWKKGVIPHTQFSDLLRLELLIRYGGLWLDATVFCTSDERDIPDYFFNSDLFLFQYLKPGRDGHSHVNSSWLISAKTNNRILMATRELCYEYWKRNDRLVDFYYLHDFMAIVSEFYSNEWHEIIPRDNATPHILLLRLFEQYDESMWRSICEQTPFHKLTYKSTDEEKATPGTFYQKIINDI